MASRRAIKPTVEVFSRTASPACDYGRPNRAQKSFRSAAGLEDIAPPCEVERAQRRIDFLRNRERACEGRYRSFTGHEFPRRSTCTGWIDCRPEAIAARRGRCRFWSEDRERNCATRYRSNRSGEKRNRARGGSI